MIRHATRRRLASFALALTGAGFIYAMLTVLALCARIINH